MSKTQKRKNQGRELTEKDSASSNEKTERESHRRKEKEKENLFPWSKKLGH